MFVRPCVDRCQTIPHQLSCLVTRRGLPHDVERAQLRPSNTPKRSRSAASHSPPQDNSLDRFLAERRALAGRVSQRKHVLDLRVSATNASSEEDLGGKPARSHADLESFLSYTTEHKLDRDSAVFKGTLYEYVVAETLKRFDMTLERVGKSNDLGIDLIGRWTLPSTSVAPIVIQCKMSRPLPQAIRELEGACSTASTTWTGDNKLALLASCQTASPGVIRAMQRSALSMGFLQITLEGIVKQFLWNASAAEHALAGVGTTTQHAATRNPITDNAASHQPAATSISLTWLARPWKLADKQTNSMQNNLPG